MQKKTCKNSVGKIGVFIKTHKVLALQLGIMGAIMMTGGTSFADTSTGGNLSSIVTPLQSISSLLTGPVATAVGTAGAAILGIATASGMENQIAKRAMQGAGGIGCGIGAAKVVSTFGASMLLL